MYSELRQAFDLFDSDSSGGISIVELKQALRALGVSITDEEARQMFSAIDIDSKKNAISLKINLSSYCFRKWSVMRNKNSSFYFFCFSIGRIEFDEFAEIVADFYFKKYSRAEILEAFKRFDHNRDGFIEADELKNILSQLGRNFSVEEVRLFRNNLEGYILSIF